MATHKRDNSVGDDFKSHEFMHLIFELHEFMSIKYSNSLEKLDDFERYQFVGTRFLHNYNIYIYTYISISIYTYTYIYI